MFLLSIAAFLINSCRAAALVICLALDSFKDAEVRKRTLEAETEAVNRARSEEKARNEAEKEKQNEAYRKAVDTLGNGLKRFADGDFEHRINDEFPEAKAEVMALMDELTATIKSGDGHESQISAKANLTTKKLYDVFYYRYQCLKLAKEHMLLLPSTSTLFLPLFLFYHIIMSLRKAKQLLEKKKQIEAKPTPEDDEDD